MPLILGTNSIKDTGFDVANSLRFNGDNFLSRTNPSATSTNDKKGTFSFWIKRDKFPNESQVLVHQADSSPKRFALQIANNDEFIFSIRNDAESVDIDGTTTLDTLYRDVSAWYHLVFNYDTSGGTNGCKLFKNGVEQALTYSNTLPQNFVMVPNTSSFANHTIGRDSLNSSNFWTGYMTEVMFVDGQQLAPTEFGEYDEDSGIWKAKDITGINVGNLGYYLDFENASSLGTDAKGVGNFTATNCATTDQSTDTCTNNFATLNPLDGHISHVVFSKGNLKSDFGSTASKKSFVRSTIGVASGKWYFEAKVIQNANFFVIGISDRPSPSDTTELGYGAYDYAYANDGGSFSKGNNGTFSSYGDSYTTNDIIGVAVDLDNNKIYFSKNGTFQNSGNPTNGTNPAFTITAPSSTDHGFYFFCVGDMTAANNAIWSANFGSPSYSESGGNSDGNGYGNFAGSVPSGYYALNTKNLAEYG